ncbi:hypothetical protein P4310_29990 [Bacillus thuringiensis]|uniref:hypothetical protein n=1 Tax=Bacillus thuringiensis TaxID=1428 RepID=UPI000A37BAEE|nr:hypothetical protein [Bacillus thuringiensis]MED3069640.1 hypothetical protein [Bacillus thuringiensis]OUB35627.1 hypothetical protein BK737_05375 [Bacillus thuringiensis serovar palmanyolensis]
MDQFRDKLMLGAIPIHQIYKNRIPLSQFDEVQYMGEQYIIIWHPIYGEFLVSHCTGEFIPFNVLDKVEYIKNLKDSHPIKKKHLIYELKIILEESYS